ncbi:MAG: PilN domain-containing protein [Bacillota bacterium]
MSYVSLLPPEIKTKKQQERKQGIIIRIALLLFVIVLVIYAFLLVSSIMARSDLEALRSERELLENQAAALEEYEILYNEMNDAEIRLNQAMGEAPPWGRLIQDLGMTLPPGVWLSDLSVNFSEESGSFNMRGWAYTHSGVAEMREELEKMDQLTDFRVQVSTETTYDGQEAVQFVLDAVLLPGSPYLDLDDAQEGQPDPEQETEPEEEVN